MRFKNNENIKEVQFHYSYSYSLCSDAKRRKACLCFKTENQGRTSGETVQFVPSPRLWVAGGMWGGGHCEQPRQQYTCTVKAVHKVTI